MGQIETLDIKRDVLLNSFFYMNLRVSFEGFDH